MKKVIAIVLAAGILFQSFSKVIIFFNYEVNKDFIAQNLCVNRNKPQMHCNGLCHLKKQFAKAEKQEESVPFQNMKDKNEIQFFSFCKIPATNSIFNCEIVFADYSFYLTSNPHSSVFHPPSAA
ncbi:MAG TPA: hypothetical protein VII99_06935 [Bacteroidia bacterium]